MQTERVTIPYSPRPLQLVLHEALRSHRFAVAVCHRRFGKTVLAVNHLIRSAIECQRERPRFAYVAPTFVQGKQIAWDYLKHFAGVIPGVSFNEVELRVDLPNGGQVRIYGADNPDRLRGIYLDGVVLDEYGLMPGRTFSEVIAPTLVDRGGWAFFIGTPNGKNHFYDVVQQARTERGWYCASYRASDTGLIDPDELTRARTVMTADEYAQEFECSFEASVKGAVYAKELQALREEGRITSVPYESMLPVTTYWDLGIGDATAIWFAQATPSGEIRLIDYYESSDQPLSHYIGVVKGKPYVYGDHWAPHDIEVREFTSGTTRLEMARSLGMHFRVGKRLPIEDGLNAVRMALPKCWFDADKTAKGREALLNYRYRLNTRLDEFDRHAPEHDWASHGADAFRLLALHLVPPGAQDVAKFTARRATALIAQEAERLQRVGPTGETLMQAAERLSKLNRVHRDRDPQDRKMAGGRRRGGW